ncbi:5-carboxymethyl-2-hydroxymuconate isomerase [Thalassotalea piscium]|uniref:5-carboxymethyl-2-hydroxymuconate isomerase n=1 Tax=Thalassotalea piscium TaxID=1230533 RepID=A0A7X0NHY7_9GAMM|nr:5-carboxymethyl-2-hydroxymuconate isomerase [Thalassotalea piscium]MBB6543787.1 5-carboxymethyl-2-hydroxymuconate isomerase [Thalassotalea piscium]
MPHCIIEYAQPIEVLVSPEALIHAVYVGALNSQLFEAEDIKTRIIPFNHYSSGIIKQNFIHISLKILSGRTFQQRKVLSSAVLT